MAEGDCNINVEDLLARTVGNMDGNAFSIERGESLGLDRGVSNLTSYEIGDVHNYWWASKYAHDPLPREVLSQTGMPSNVVFQGIQDLRNLDHNPRLNLASFVTTWMEPEVKEIIMDSLNVNYIDNEIYKSSTEIHDRCVKMLANLYHAPDSKDVIGTGTLGSSEAIMLAGLAMKKAWTERRKAAGLPYDKPNLVMGYNVQVCWEKFCRYWDVEERFVPLTEDCFVATPEGIAELCDENTIGVAGILGSTYNGEYEDIKGIDAKVEELNEKNGWEIKIHVDAASGGFVAPFAQPELVWDFRLKNVISINVSGHKYGLVYPGVGWVIWRNTEVLPKDMIFWTNYLGTDMPSITLNFSRPAFPFIAQYYQLCRCGFQGYRGVMQNLMRVAARLREGLLATGHFKILSDNKSLPLVAFCLVPVTDKKGKEHPRVYDEFELADKLRQKGWVLPAYTMAPNARHVKLLRAVIRQDMSMEMAEHLIEDIIECVQWLDAHFIFTEEQMKLLREKFQFARLDTNILRAKKHNGIC